MVAILFCQDTLYKEFASIVAVFVASQVTVKVVLVFLSPQHFECGFSGEVKQARWIQLVLLSIVLESTKIAHMRYTEPLLGLAEDLVHSK